MGSTQIVTWVNMLDTFCCTRHQVKLGHRDSIHGFGPSRLTFQLASSSAPLPPKPRVRKLSHWPRLAPARMIGQLLDGGLIKVDFAAVESHRLGRILPVVLLDVGSHPRGPLLALVIDGARLHIVVLHHCLELVPGKIRLRTLKLRCRSIQLGDDFLQICVAGRQV